MDLLGCNKDRLTAHLTDLGANPVHASKLLQAIHQQGQLDVRQMDFLPRAAQAQLAEHPITLPTITYQAQSADGTYKWLLTLSDGAQIETVLIPEPNRLTLCISSQVGCALSGMKNNLACRFCATGKQTFMRNLTTAEIIAQVWFARHQSPPGLMGKVTNVVLMGMGEPLANFQPVVDAMDIMMDDYGYGLSKYRVTLSTAGIIPALKRLKTASPCALAVSLHATNDTLRNQLVPLNQKYPLAELMSVCRDYYAESPKRAIVFEYVLLKGVNDTPEHAQELVQLIKGIRSKVNLIPFNPFPQAEFNKPDHEAVLIFRAVLAQAGVNVTVRKTRGDEINAACGQLVG